jgi:dihydroorotate dehydrogenase
LFHRSTVVLARVFQLTGGKIPLIGIGGVEDGATALAKIEAGASLVQLYTGMIYGGPGLISDMTRTLSQTLDRERLANVSALIGRRADAWASKAVDG